MELWVNAHDQLPGSSVTRRLRGETSSQYCGSPVFEIFVHFALNAWRAPYRPRLRSNARTSACARAARASRSGSPGRTSPLPTPKATAPAAT